MKPYEALEQGFERRGDRLDKLNGALDEIETVLSAQPNSQSLSPAEAFERLHRVREIVSKARL